MSAAGAKRFVEGVKRAERQRADEAIGDVRCLVLHVRPRGYEIAEHAEDPLGLVVARHRIDVREGAEASAAIAELARQRGYRGGRLDVTDAYAMSLRHEDPTICEVWR